MAIFYQKVKDKEFRTSQLINYFYDLRSLLRNLAIFSNNLMVVRKCFLETGTLLTPPVSYIKYRLNDELLNFIESRDSLYYEEIKQLKIEYDSITDLFYAYTEKKEIIYIDQMVLAIIKILPKIIQILYTTDDYLQKRLKAHTLINENIKQNISECERCVDNFLKDLEEKYKNCSNEIEKQAILNNMHEIKATQTGWRVRFEKSVSITNRIKKYLFFFHFNNKSN